MHARLRRLRVAGRVSGGVRLLGAEPDLQLLGSEAAGREGRGGLATLAAAEQVIAREHGFASWQRLADEVDARALPSSDRAAALIASACSSNLRRARTLLAADPELARHDIATVCVTGEPEELAARLAAAPELARRSAPPFGWQPMLYACFSRFLRVEPQRARGIRDAVRLLLAAGADPNASFDHGGWLQVPLYGAAGIANDPELTELLLDAGANPNDAGLGREVGEALYHAVEFSDPTCARLLVRAGTDRHVVDHALGRALNFPRLAVVEMLCAEGATPSAAQLQQAVSKRRPARTIGALLAAGAPFDEPDADGLTPLQVAVRWGEEETVALLLERGADRSAVTDEDRALGAYLRGGAAGQLPESGLRAMLGVAVQSGDRDAVSRLLDAGLAADGWPSDDDVPLGQAAWRGQPAVVEELLERGASPAWAEGSALGAALHGSLHCHDPQGGPTMRTVREIPRARYRELVGALLARGSATPERLWPGAPSLETLLVELGIVSCTRPLQAGPPES